MGGFIEQPVEIFLGGDVMTGRGVDHILPHRGDPGLQEPRVHHAGTYVQLAEQVNGPVPRPVGFEWPWGAALTILDQAAPDVRVINLETSVTRRGQADASKSVHYRMSPENMPTLTAAGLHTCTLANNHICDFGGGGMHDTLQTLAAAGIATTGAGDTLEHARRPVVLPVGTGRVIISAIAEASSGVPAHWAAGLRRLGVELLPSLSQTGAERAAEQVAQRIARTATRPGDRTVVSVHWGSNWGYDVPAAHVRFARRLIDGGIDIVFGHSSHHPRPIEIYRDKLILYGCGDLINDYEGIGPRQEFRDDLRLLYFAALDPGSGRLIGLRMVPLQARQLRLHRVTRSDTTWLRQLLADISAPFGVDVAEGSDDMLHLQL